ncbi:MAG TPA: BamA/TamA family outer membrane protein [Candidatus Gastranaerophilales bacterium]|nr:BamA/TamA family outer membrane protein [Candidatus Gastranaerophilales bacterium]
MCKIQDEDGEEKQFTEAEDIDPEKLNTKNDRTYDDAITIKEINIKGNSLVSKDKILNELKIAPGSKFNRELIKDRLKNIYEMGYFTERIKAIPEADSSGIILNIEIEENAPVTGFNLKGNEAVSSDEILALLEDQLSLPQNIAKLNSSIQAVENLYAQKGYILARVKKVQDDPDGIINIDINEGIIDEIELSGNTKTKDFVIKRNLTIKPGEVYNEDKLKQDLTRIFGTQAFSDVRRVISPSVNDPAKYKLAIEVDEKRTGSISLGGGIDTESGLFGQAGYFDNNFLGRGQEIGANFMMGSGTVLSNNGVLDDSPVQVELKFIEPRLMQSMNSLQVSAFMNNMASYQVPLSMEKRIGGMVELARPIKDIPNLAGSINLGVEDVRMKEGDATEIARLFAEKNINIDERAKQLQGGTFISLGPSLVYDSRNKLLNPTDGWYASARFKESFAVSGASETFGKGNFIIRKFFPVGKESTITVGAKLGSKMLGTLPEFDAFRLGGPYTIRGFREGDVGSGEGFMMASAEFRTPIPFINKYLDYKIIKDIRLAFFLDAGKVYNEMLTNSLYNYPGHAMSIGTGMLIPLPYLGSIRFDYGYALTSVGTGNKKGRFTFGIGERY